MSFDLEYWYFVNPKYPRRKLKTYRLNVIGANHSDIDLGMWWCTADIKFSFEDQIKKVVLRNQKYNQDPEVILKFEEDAKEFKILADKMGYKVRSYWI